MYVKEIIIVHIRDNKTSKDIWDTLKGLYEKTNTNLVLLSKSKFLSIKKEENENVNNFVFRIKELKEKLGDIGENISSIYL
jgi:hypothetical protein